jgi:DNA primase
MKLSQLPLYGAEQVESWHPDDLIVLCEGEKAGDALDRAGFNALGTVTGSSGTPGPEALEVLRNRLVCLWPDNDAPGRKHMERLAAALEGVAAEVLLYEWDEAPEGGDAADHPAVLKGSPGAVDRLLTDLLRLSPAFGEAKQIEHRRVARGLQKLSQRPQNEASNCSQTVASEIQTQLLDGGSLLATNLDHQKLGRAHPDGTP